MKNDSYFYSFGNFWKLLVHQLSSTLGLSCKSLVGSLQHIVIVGQGMATVVIHDKLWGYIGLCRRRGHIRNLYVLRHVLGSFLTQYWSRDDDEYDPPFGCV